MPESCDKDTSNSRVRTFFRGDPAIGMDVARSLSGIDIRAQDHARPNPGAPDL
jgi:hypothetical protein